MRGIWALTVLAALVGILAGASGCSRSTLDQPPEVAPSEIDRERLSGMLDSLRSIGGEPHLQTPALTSEEPATAGTPLLLSDIHFEYDKANLTELAQSIMADNALALSQHTGVRIRIEGHCDERGTSEYNLALGERRARTVHDYLVNYGIDAGRLRSVSYGEERPLDTASTERAWAKNRRAHLEPLD